jgi:polysaccharide biosynthesis/export protein
MRTSRAAAIAACVVLSASAAAGQQRAGAASASGSAAAVSAAPEFTIGAGDVLQVNFWRETEMSSEVVVRPDGKITIPLIKEVSAAGLTPKQLEEELETRAKQYVQEPNATVTVRTINSRQVYITGNVARAGAFPLNGPTTVLQLIAQAGGVLEYADSSNIVILRSKGGKPETFRFDYRAIVQQKKLTENIELQPGDTVLVP